MKKNVQNVYETPVTEEVKVEIVPIMEGTIGGGGSGSGGDDNNED